MSTDTRYFNSSRLMTASSKNKTNGVTRLDKKRSQAEKKNKMRQETVVIPQPQLLPNGGKPDFGHSSSRRKQRNSSAGRHVSLPDSERKNGERELNTQQVTEDLKQLFLKPEDANLKGKTKGSGEKSRKAKQGRPATSPSSSENRANPSGTGFQSPDLHTASICSPHQGHNPLGSPVFVGPGLYPPPSPSSAPQGLFGHTYGNYSVASPASGPHFMTPQAPLMNPLYPQLPLPQLPVMYKALDIQQQQLQQQQQQQQQVISDQSYQHYHLQQQQQFNLPNMAVPYSLPLTASYCNGPPVTAVKPLEQEKPRKKNKDKTNGTSTCFAGASFASSDPKVTNLPKPSFTKA
ncbi:hypothetical protein HG537_0D00670 [Torulaspora globosa]|uniref:Enhancer of mRNA-decapping protein 1 n=1 Tax=Torulaspora globosa TaxID=48254 RepID=A0A7H9HTM9_9SACH|nr:hypothetical protein HG537_0D00670 [Torulaspora sp. CBS 2947]